MAVEDELDIRGFRLRNYMIGKAKKVVFYMIAKGNSKYL